MAVVTAELKEHSHGYDHDIHPVLDSHVFLGLDEVADVFPGDFTDQLNRQVLLQPRQSPQIIFLRAFCQPTVEPKMVDELFD